MSTRRTSVAPVTLRQLSAGVSEIADFGPRCRKGPLGVVTGPPESRPFGLRGGYFVDPARVGQPNERSARVRSTSTGRVETRLLITVAPYLPKGGLYSSLCPITATRSLSTLYVLERPSRT